MGLASMRAACDAWFVGSEDPSRAPVLSLSRLGKGVDVRPSVGSGTVPHAKSARGRVSHLPAGGRQRTSDPRADMPHEPNRWRVGWNSKTQPGKIAIA